MPSRKIGAFFAALMIVMAGLVAVGAAPASAALTGPPQGVHLKIIQVNSGKCLDVTGYSYSNGARLQLYDCFPGNNSQHYNQQFYLWQVSGEVYYRIYSAWSGLCLDIEGYSLDAGAALQQYQCLGPDSEHRNQQFTLIPAGDGYYIQPAHSGLRLTYQGAFNGAAVFQWPGSSVAWALVYP